jgi:transcriptional regulator with XRE-family HTH domain
VINLIIETILKRQGITKYQLAQKSGIPYTTLSDICSGKSKIEKSNAETIYKISKALGVSMELLTESGIRDSEKEKAYETGLPKYLQHDLDAYKDGLKNGSKVMDCLWGELYGSINIAEIDDNAITHEHADYLRKKYLW